MIVLKRYKKITNKEFTQLIKQLSPTNKMMVYAFASMCNKVSEIDDLELKDFIRMIKK